MMPPVVPIPDPIVDGATIAFLRVAVVYSGPVHTTAADASEPVGVDLDVACTRPRRAPDRVSISDRPSRMPGRLPLQRILSP
ncbi:MAG: hypothetical protein ACRD1B_10550 [Thermoanaerobaculia bacterium]